MQAKKRRKNEDAVYLERSVSFWKVSVEERERERERERCWEC